MDYIYININCSVLRTALAEYSNLNIIGLTHFIIFKFVTHYSYFGANTPFSDKQLSPGTISILPLTTSHPLILQH